MEGAQGFRLVLASASPRRKELLAQAGYFFEVAATDVDESVRAGEAPEDYVQRLAEEKARVVFGRYAEAPHRDEVAMNGAQNCDVLIVVGADTTVVCDGEILGKPVNAGDAMRMLRMLAGRTHEVLTGIAVVSADGAARGVETTLVTFSEIPVAELEAYCGTSEPMDKAGAYGIQGYAARWIPRIEGCYFNVMGLPIARAVRMMEEALRETNSSRATRQPHST